MDIFKKKYIIVPINEKCVFFSLEWHLPLTVADTCSRSSFHWYLAIIENPENMLHPPPPEIVVKKPQTRKRKRESDAVAEAVVAEDQDVVADDDKGEGRAVAPNETSEQPAHPDSVPSADAMVVDVAESEGEGQEVDDMLRMTQSCSIHEAENEPAAQETDKVGATIYDEVFDIESMELQYPASDDMDVDPAPMTVEDSEEERKPPDRALPPETITVEDEEDAVCVGGEAKPAGEVEAGEPTMEPPNDGVKEDGGSSAGDEGEPEPAAAAEDASQLPK